jgi:hypothetical protein
MRTSFLFFAERCLAGGMFLPSDLPFLPPLLKGGQGGFCSPAPQPSPSRGEGSFLPPFVQGGQGGFLLSRPASRLPEIPLSSPLPKGDRNYSSLIQGVREDSPPPHPSPLPPGEREPFAPPCSRGGRGDFPRPSPSPRPSPGGRGSSYLTGRRIRLARYTDNASSSGWSVVITTWSIPSSRHP